MKIIRAVRRYVEAAKIEADVLKEVNMQVTTDESHIVRLYDDFQYGDNYCLCFELLGVSLYEFLKNNKYRGFLITQVQSFARQILEAVAFLHSLNLTHTDLKLENLLLVNSDFDQVPIEKYAAARVSSSPSTSVESGDKSIFLKPKCSDIKLIDFGGATFERDHHTKIINTRQYRAPEVILECG